ncbi:MAG: hypothetical protein K6E95_03835 [Lachnospiraceae bacterium]|nr:hypothetical protein [Lachnospiraceae bacterium]
MKSRIFGVICMIVLIAVTLVTTIVVTFDQCRVYAPAEENVMYGTTDSSGNNYVYFESRSNSGIYKLNDAKKLIASATDSNGSMLNGGRVVGLACVSNKVYMAVRIPLGVRICAWNEELTERTENTISFKGDAVVTDFGVNNGDLAIVTVEDQGTTAAVYMMSGRDNEPVNLLREDAEGEVRFLDANFINGKLETLMSDGSRTPGYENSIVEKTEVPENAGLVGVTMGFPTVARNVLIMVAVIFIIAFFFRSVVFKRNYLWLKVYGFMIALTACLAASIYLVTEPVNESRVEERVKQTENVLDIYGQSFNDYDGSIGTERYDNAYKTVRECWWETTESIEDICILSINNSRAYVNVSMNFPYGEWLSDKWGDAADKCILGAHSSNGPVWGETVIKGKKYLMVTAPVTDEAGSRVFISALVRYEDIMSDSVFDISMFILHMVIVWGIALALIIFINFGRAFELKIITKTLRRVISGEQTEVVKPKIASMDFDGMWNAAAELSKGMGKKNYLRNQTLAMVGRFAPHNIEKLFGKDSLTDVRLGDKGSVNGTVALIRIARPFIRNKNEYTDIMSRYIEIICKYKNEHEGILVSDSSTMCSSRVIFADGANGTLSFAVKTSEAIRKSELSQGRRSLIFLHKTEYEYGITGSEDQNYACINSLQLDLISVFVPKLSELGLRVVASEEALNADEGSYTSRYLGYLELPDNSGTVRLYEILDAVPVEERNRKTETVMIFKKALDLYYAKDFYLARNLFAEAVKECPEDLVARWYLFKCEKMLDVGTVEKFGYGLLSE